MTQDSNFVILIFSSLDVTTAFAIKIFIGNSVSKINKCRKASK